MGLIQAGLGALGGTLADQWKEFFYCDSLSRDVLMVKGQKKLTSKSSNTAGSDNIITNGSGIVVNEGQCMIIVDQGKIVEFCAAPGEYTWDASTEPSLFTGKFGQSLLDTFKTVGKRFTYGGEIPKDQRVYYFNMKEIPENTFGTKTPIIFRVVDKNINLDTDVQLRCNGYYSFRIKNPLLFYSKVAGNVVDSYRTDTILPMMKTEFISALQPAMSRLSDLEMRPSQIGAHLEELAEAVNIELAPKWIDGRGIECVSIAMNPPSLSEEDQKKLTDAQYEGRYTNVNQAAAGLAAAQMQAMKDAANNSAGAMTGFLGMGFAQQQGQTSNVSSLFQMAEQKNAEAAKAQQAQTAAAADQDEWVCPKCGSKVSGKFCTECGEKKPEAADGWTCTSCGHVNKGKFCQECGAKKPEGALQYACDKCGWQPEDPTKPPKFCPECGDPFDENDIKK